MVMSEKIPSPAKVRVELGLREAVCVEVLTVTRKALGVVPARATLAGEIEHDAYCGAPVQASVTAPLKVLVPAMERS
jgi:hypothetical protein